MKEESGQSCVVAGNSLGGFTALYAAASEAATSGTGNFHETRSILHCKIALFLNSFLDYVVHLVLVVEHDLNTILTQRLYKHIGLINGAILLNAAGRFKETSKPEVVDTRPQW